MPLIVLGNVCREIGWLFLNVNKNMMSLRGQASWAKMTSLRGKLTAPPFHPTKFVNKAELRIFLSTNIGFGVDLSN